MKSSLPSSTSPWPEPWVQLKYFTFTTAIYSRMLAKVSRRIAAGSLVSVYDPEGNFFGMGLYNPTARIPLRMVHHGKSPVDESFLDERIRHAVHFRKHWLGLPQESTDAFRAFNAEGDGISGLIVDVYATVLSIQVTSLAVYQRLNRWIPVFHEAFGTSSESVSVDPEIARIESIPLEENRVNRQKFKIREHGVRFEIDFTTGHKTGFFCDQRENRLRFAKRVAGMRVLDLCCYTGAFALQAVLLGKAREVTAVDLDEKAILQAQRNANLNQMPPSQIRFVHADAFTYARQMQRNGETYQAILLDPPKLIHGREEEDINDGLKKYEDLNHLGAKLAEPGALFVTCSCSGLLSAGDFEGVALKGIHKAGRRAQIIDRTGPGEDHPEYSNHPEGRYLKVIWCRIW